MNSNIPGMFFPKWRQTVIRQDANLKDALEAISRSGAYIACIVGTDERMAAIVTDSDVRRALLKGGNLGDNVMIWAQTKPVTASCMSEASELAEIAREYGVREIPMLDSYGRLADIFVLAVHERREILANDGSGPDLNVRNPLPNYMLILAGGLGTRLKSVVSDRPKPLAMVGDKPIIETLIMHAARSGIKNFYVAVNYMSHLIEEHLNSPIYASLNIHILRESQKLGTAGAIGLIPDNLDKPILVGNADLLTTVPLHQLIHHHNDEKADITCAVRPYEVTIPFGVVDMNDKKVLRIREKPKYQHFVNAGIYVIDPGVCKLVQQDERLDMPELIQRVIQRNLNVVPFLMHEYWMDIGRPEDFQRANQDYHHYFGDKFL
jgi:dTDP-glucose pyrophosphorylase